MQRTWYTLKATVHVLSYFTVLERNLFYCFRTGSCFTVLELDLCAENTVHCGGNGSRVKLFTVLERDLCAENTVRCGGNGSCVKLSTVLEPDLVLLFYNWIYVQRTQYIVEAMVHALSCLLF